VNPNGAEHHEGEAWVPVASEVEKSDDLGWLGHATNPKAHGEYDP
jgi:hypothetical protein